MGTTSTELPPMDKISLIGIWVETLLYGVNCVMYSLCMFFLLRRRKTATLRWVHLATSTILFVLGTVHAGASLQQLFDAFVYAPADAPDYSTTYWLDYTTSMRMLKDYVYATLTLAQYWILTRRVYVVFMFDWRIVVFPIILALGGMGFIYAAWAVSALPKDGLNEAFLRLVITALGLGCVHNVFVTLAIAARLSWMDRSIASLTDTSTNRTSSLIYTAVESGAISALCSTVVLAVFASSSPASFTSLDVAAQLIVLAPLLKYCRTGWEDR